MHNHGWQFLWHIEFKRRYTQLLSSVEKQARKDPDNFIDSRIYKHYKSIKTVVFDRIYNNPLEEQFNQGNTLGKKFRHWKRAKKEMPPRYRIFFQFNSEQNSIVLAWLNDDKSIRRDGHKSDVYNVFKKMLSNKTIPNTYTDLLKQSKNISEEYKSEP